MESKNYELIEIELELKELIESWSEMEKYLSRII